jgi:NAD(P)-dependent dehydrogenase (short-subunit alcohol dehydrogenase family)
VAAAARSIAQLSGTGPVTVPKKYMNLTSRSNNCLIAVVTPPIGVALVVAGTRGIGLATALTLAEQGAPVAVTYRKDPDAATAAAERLEAANPGRTLVLQSDARSWDDAARTVAQVEEELGPIATLVNNAGWGMFKTIEDTDPSYWQYMWSINLDSAVIHATTVGRRMLERGRGSIVNMSAVSGFRAMERRGAHCVAKAGVNMLTQCLALEWGARGVRTNAVAPGVVGTDYVKGMMAKGLISEQVAIDSTPLGRVAEEREIASVIAFLASDAASYINGQTILIDGGWLSHGGRF